ncbi:glycoside hydrolase family 172 protein [Plantactinospora sonchi]|uniref:Glycoside hydrolase family 172 protein n=1 Tax=Plantactinospora sonchi TaxID=1544735 RepID=A0ABU7S3X4_9ACTN
MNSYGVAGLSGITTGRTRSVSPENPTGGKGMGGRAVDGTGAHAARELGQGWKVSPSVVVPPGQHTVLADVEGPAVVRHIWFAVHPDHLRTLVLRGYWEESTRPAISVPLGDFFCQGWAEYAPVNSIPVVVNPYGGLNCYWEMPFRRRARLVLENPGPVPVTVFYQIDYELVEVEAAAGYLHACWRRSNPLAALEEHVLLTGVPGPGHYVGTYLAWGSNSGGWWGEGEVKCYLDGDDQFPTICGTGTEDYVGGAWGFDVPGQGYTTYTTPYLGFHQVVRQDGQARSQQRFGMYRWHLPDPIRFERDIRMTVQALGWRSGERYLPLRDDVASTAWWYAAQPEGIGLPGPELDEMEVI